MRWRARKRMNIGAALCAATCIFLADGAAAAAPRMYHQPQYESPVGGNPDDLLLLAGDGFTADDVVVYRAILDTTKPAAPPPQVPAVATPMTGIATVMSRADIPHSLTVGLPAVMRPDQSYALWVRTVHGEWSEPVLINDARPLWFTPSFVYSSRSTAGLRRELKVVGRNLQPASGAVTQIQLVGPNTYTNSAIVDAQTSEALNRYTARLKLPPLLAPGHYHLLVCRDGVSWVGVADQVLEVRPDGIEPPSFPVSDARFGGCRPDDGRDDTPCIARAISAAKRAGGGIVSFGPGTWDLIDNVQQGGAVAGEGIVVQDGVTLRGAGAHLTRLDRHAEWNAHAPTPAFTLVGHTEISGFRFRDLQVYVPSDQAGAFLQLGEPYGRVAATAGSASPALASVDDVMISRNTFDKTFVGWW
jgi:hypothetical protein